VTRQIIEKFPWDSAVEQRFLLVRDSRGRYERVEISHLTLQNGKMDGVRMFGALLLNITFSCKANFYGPACDIGCSYSANNHDCNPVTGDYICLGNHYGEYCLEELCLNNSTYSGGVCT
ncbi:hypothetical protein PMAYCL1PPCAC_27238, partial [Pristionchus mayeri]